MGQLVSIEKLDDGKTKISIQPMPKTINHYKILVRQGGLRAFDDNIVSETLLDTKSYFENDKQGHTYWHIHLNQHNPKTKYYVVFDKTKWVQSNIKDITSQILNQEEQIFVNIVLKNYVKELTQAVRNNNYSSLIQKMIIDNADTLTNLDIAEIQRTLTDVKEEKGLITHPATKFGI